jgi:hypothetical protein
VAVLDSAIARHILPEDFLSFRERTGQFSGKTDDSLPYSTLAVLSSMQTIFKKAGFFRRIFV